MSTITYKHSLRRHVPSRRDEHSPTSSPPSTPPKSSAASIKSHHSKREKVKETVDHLLHKFHIPHHHHQHHEHEHGQDGSLSPDGSQEKKSFLVKRASFASSLRASSLKRKSTTSGVDMPVLSYKISPASSSSSSLEDEHPSSGASSKSVKEEKPLSVASSPCAQLSRIPVLSVSPAKPSAEVTPSAPTVAVPKETYVPQTAQEPAPLLLTAEQLFHESHHHHSKREQVKEVIDHALHKLHVPHHHHHQQPTPPPTLVIVGASGTTPVAASIAIEEPPTTGVMAPSVSTAPSEEFTTSEVESDEVIKTLPSETQCKQAETLVDCPPVVSPVEAQICTPEAAVVSPADVQGDRTVKQEDNCVEPIAQDPAPTTAALTGLIPVEPTAALSEAVVASVEPPVVPTTEPAVPTALVPEASPCITDFQPEPSTALVSAPTSFPDTPSPPRRPIDTPVITPIYFNLRKATVSKLGRHTKKPSWFQYIYGSFVKPVVVIAVECTVAAVCYGLTKILEAKPAPIALPSEQLSLA